MPTYMRIVVSPELWTKLNELKTPGDDFETVIRKLLDHYKQAPVEVS